MRLALLILCLVCSVYAYAQPVISNGNNIPLPGLTAPISFGSAAGGVGSPGANQTWDVSAVSFSPIGMVTTIAPSSSPFASSFHSATSAYTFANTYSYFSTSAAKMEALAYAITAPGTGNDFSPNPRTVLKFPFNFNDSETDTWQAVGGSPNSVTITYDGYGTLITPTATYNNVVRVKEEYGSGVDYQWYILEPLMSVLVYSNGTNAFYLTSATQTTDVVDNNRLALSVVVFPNPATDKFVLRFGDYSFPENATLRLLDVAGRVIKQMPLNATSTTIELDNIGAGVYLYQLIVDEKTMKSGTVIVE
ncbi:MAG: T9SS type A sorting domain-containing protein [bacterium]|nr:T9SS type A sorting domain-containing protein [bacterium]